MDLASSGFPPSRLSGYRNPEGRVNVRGWRATTTPRRRRILLEHEVRVWTVYAEDGRLILAMSDEPGEFNFARLPGPGVPPVMVPFATIQCYDTKREATLLGRVLEAEDADDLVDRLEQAGFRVEMGRPKTGRFARL